jgi:plasmid stability protein
LRARAFRNRRSVAAEIRAILEEATDPSGRLKMGSTLVNLFRPLGGVDLDIRRDQSRAEPPHFD